MQALSDEIEDEVQRVELLPGQEASMNRYDSNFTDYSDDTDENYEETLIDRYEQQAEFWRDNYYKFWR